MGKKEDEVIAIKFLMGLHALYTCRILRACTSGPLTALRKQFLPRVAKQKNSAMHNVKNLI